MKTTMLFFLLLFISVAGYAQKPIPAYGEFSTGELNLKTCSIEEADAMKLFDVKEVEYEPSPFGGKIKTTHRVRLKIFNEKGYPAATVTIPYYDKNNSKLDYLKAVVCNLDAGGQLVSRELEEAEFYKEKAMDKIGVARFTFPNLKPGSVIEYMYEVTEKNRLQIDNWILQSEIPALYSSLSIIIPTFSQLKEISFGGDSIARNTEILTKGLDKEKTTFFKENIRSFKPEPFMSSFNDNVLRMAFLFLPDKNEIVKSFTSQSLWRITANMILKSNFYNEQLKKEVPGTEKIIDTARGLLNMEDRLRYIHSVLKKRFSENPTQSSSASDITDAWKKKSGSSAAINFLLHNMLTRAGVPNYPAFISTREHGKINKDFPSFGQFNGMDVLVDINGTKYLVDASLRYQSYLIPPLNVLNREALVLNPENIHWVMVTDDRPLIKQTVDIFGTMTNAGILEGGATINYYDYAKALALDSTSELEKKQTWFDKNIPGLKILSDNKVMPANDEPFMQTIEFDYTPVSQGDFYFVNPQAFVSGKINPFSADKRFTEIDFGCNKELRLTMQLDIPANIKMEELPKNIVVKSPDESFVFTRMVSLYQSKISFSQVLEIKKAIFSKDDYPALTDFFKQIQSLASEEIILKKIK